MPSSFGVYVHFPWCLKKCPYCDFVSFAAAREAIDHARYADAVLAEIEARSDVFPEQELASVFFGGGTPSLWQPEELGRVLARVLEAAPAKAAEVEVTVECNPTSLDEERARAMLAVGVNRLSVGVQGLDADRLKFLGRLHDENGGLEAVRAALAAGAPRVSGDLIYGVATADRAMTPDEAAQEAVRVARTGVTHVSAYSLTIEPGTQFGELSRRNKLPLAQDDDVADAFLAIDRALEGEGLRHYEISNYARPGDEARHNLGYWRGDDYVGLGCAAYGTLSTSDGHAERARNEIDPAKYMTKALAREKVSIHDERLDPETRLRERIMLGLRLATGLELARAAEELGVEAWPAHRRRAADRLLARGRLEEREGSLRVPRAAWVFTDGIAADLF